MTQRGTIILAKLGPHHQNGCCGFPKTPCATRLPKSGTLAAEPSGVQVPKCRGTWYWVPNTIQYNDISLRVQVLSCKVSAQHHNFDLRSIEGLHAQCLRLMDPCIRVGVYGPLLRNGSKPTRRGWPQITIGSFRERGPRGRGNRGTLGKQGELWGTLRNLWPLSGFHKIRCNANNSIRGQ